MIKNKQRREALAKVSYSAVKEFLRSQADFKAADAGAEIARLCDLAHSRSLLFGLNQDNRIRIAFYRLRKGLRSGGETHQSIPSPKAVADETAKIAPLAPVAPAGKAPSPSSRAAQVLAEFKKRQARERALVLAEAGSAGSASPARPPSLKPDRSSEELKGKAFDNVRNLIGIGGDKGKVVVPTILQDMLERLEGFTAFFEIFVEEVLEVQRRQDEEVKRLRGEIERLKASSKESKPAGPEPDSTSSP